MDAPAKDEAAEAVVKRYDELVRARALYHPEWAQISTLLMRNRKGLESGGQPGEWQHRGVFNSAPVIAANNMAAGIYGTLTNPANKWFSLGTPDSDLNDWHRAKSWLDRATNLTLASLRPGVSNFYDAALPLYGDLACFGNGVQYDEEREEQGRILDRTLPLSEAAIARDDSGTIAELARRFALTARVAARRYGERLPPKIRERAEKAGDAEVWFVHHVGPNDRWAPGGLGPKGKPFLSRTVCVDDGPVTVALGGYHEFPAYAPFWDLDARETWARGPGYFALPDVRVLNLSTEANVRGAQEHVDPVTLAPDQRALRRDFRLHPGATLYGAMTMGGRPLVARLPGPQGLPFGIELVTRMIDDVKETFGFSLMQITNRSGMTPTEFLERQADRLRLLAPYLGNIQTHYLAAKIGRRFGILWRAGQLPPPPPELAGRPLDVKYTSAAALAQRSTEGAATSQLLQDIAPLAQIDPRVMKRIDADGVVEVLAEARGAPARVLRSREQADALAQAEAAQQQAMMAAQAAPQVSRAARDMAAIEAGTA
jgi:hypothetical protein